MFCIVLRKALSIIGLISVMLLLFIQRVAANLSIHAFRSNLMLLACRLSFVKESSNPLALFPVDAIGS